MSSIFTAALGRLRRQAHTLLRTAVVATVTAATLGLVVPAQPAYANGVVNFTRVDTEVRGGASLAAVEACANKLYTPVRDGGGKLRVIGMGLTNGNLTSLTENGNEFVGGAIHEVEVAALKGCNYFVTGVRASDHTFKLIAWFSSADAMDRLGDSGDHNLAFTEFDMVSMGMNIPSYTQGQAEGYILAAGRGVHGAFVLTTYYVNNGAFTHQHLEMGEAADKIALAALPPLTIHHGAGRAVVAYRTAQGNLRLAAYDINHAARPTLIGDSGNQAGQVQEVSIAAYDSNRVVTAVKTQEGNLLLIAWRINDDGSIDRLHGQDDPTFNDPNGGAVSEIDVTAYQFNYLPYKHVVTAVRTQDGKLKLIAWGIDGSDIVRLGDSGELAGAATQIRAAWSANNGQIVTSMRDGDGNLRVVAWNVH